MLGFKLDARFQTRSQVSSQMIGFKLDPRFQARCLVSIQMLGFKLNAWFQIRCKVKIKCQVSSQILCFKLDAWFQTKYQVISQMLGCSSVYDFASLGLQYEFASCSLVYILSCSLDNNVVGLLSLQKHQFKVHTVTQIRQFKNAHHHAA